MWIYLLYQLRAKQGQHGKFKDIICGFLLYCIKRYLKVINALHERKNISIR